MDTTLSWNFEQSPHYNLTKSHKKISVIPTLEMKQKHNLHEFFVSSWDVPERCFHPLVGIIFSSYTSFHLLYIIQIIKALVL